MAKSLSERLAKFSNPEPEDHDPEGDLSANSGSDSDYEQARAHYVEVDKSRLRDDLEVDQLKYKGKRASRKDFDEDSILSSEEKSEEEEESEEEEDSDDLKSNRVESVSEDEAVPVNRSDIEDESQEDTDGSDIDQTREDSHSEDESEDEKQSQVKNLLRQEQKQLLNRLASSNDADITKGRGVRAQMKIYENLLDLRISLQKALTASNSLSEGSVSPETSNLAKDLIGKVLDIRNKLGAPAAPKKRSFEALVEASFEEDQELFKRREVVLGKWSRKVQLSNANSAIQGQKFKSLNQSAAQQVKATLADMSRLVQRTQINRGQVKIGGEVPEESKAIFDDTDFYRTLLTDLVDKRMAESSENGLLKIAAQQKKKKIVDTKASKGRKLRYTTQDPLVSFDAPRPDVWSWNEDQAEELFSNLLGMKITMDDEEPESEEDVDVEDFALYG